MARPLPSRHSEPRRRRRISKSRGPDAAGEDPLRRRCILNHHLRKHRRGTRFRRSAAPRLRVGGAGVGSRVRPSSSSNTDGHSSRQLRRPAHGECGGPKPPLSNAARRTIWSGGRFGHRPLAWSRSRLVLRSRRASNGNTRSDHATKSVAEVLTAAGSRRSTPVKSLCV